MYLHDGDMSGIKAMSMPVPERRSVGAVLPKRREFIDQSSLSAERHLALRLAQSDSEIACATALLNRMYSRRRADRGNHYPQL